MVDQYTSSVNVPSEVKALAPMGMARMAGGEGEESLGSTLFQLAQKLQETKNLRYEANATAQINAITDDYIASLADKDPNKFDFVGGYDALQEKQNKVLAGLPRAVQDQMQNKLVLQRQSDKAYIAKYAIDRTRQIALQEIPDALENFAVHGQDEEAIAYIEKLSKTLGPPNEEGRKGWIEARIRDYQAVKAKINKDNAKDYIGSWAMADAAENGWGVTLSKLADPKQQLEFTKATGATLSDISHVLSSVKTFAQEQQVKSNEMYNVEAGKMTASFVKLIQSGDLTEQAVWDSKIYVPADKVTEANHLKSTWANIARGITERKLSESDKSLYSPQLVADLKSRAQQATSDQERNDIRAEAGKALAEGRINNDDLESISLKADTQVVTAIDSVLKDQETDFARIMLKGTSDESLVPYLQAQITASLASGKELSTSDIKEIISNFQYAAKAKQWAVNEQRRQVEAEIEKQDIKDVNSVRRISIELQRLWMNKSDTEIISEYKQWLKIK